MEAGGLIKVGDDSYKIPPALTHPQSAATPPGSMPMTLNPPLAHPPPTPVPVQQLMMDHQARNALPAHHHQTGGNRGHPGGVSGSATGTGNNMPPPSSIVVNSSSTSGNEQQQSEEQRKNDLIAAKLSKLEGKTKSPSKNKMFNLDPGAAPASHPNPEMGVSPVTGGGSGPPSIAGSTRSARNSGRMMKSEADIKKEIEDDVEDLPLNSTRRGFGGGGVGGSNNGSPITVGRGRGMAKRKNNRLASEEWQTAAVASMKAEADDDSSSTTSIGLETRVGRKKVNK